MTKDAYPSWVGPHARVGLVNLRIVAPNLWVGAMASPAFLPLDSGVDHILDVCGSSKDNVSEYPVPFTSFRLVDGQPIPFEVLDRALELMTSSSGLLVHCMAGLSRSASVAYALMRVRDGMSIPMARHRIRSLDEQGDPIYGYPLSATIDSAEAWVQDRLSKRST